MSTRELIEDALVRSHEPYVELGELLTRLGERWPRSASLARAISCEGFFLLFNESTDQYFASSTFSPNSAIGLKFIVNDDNLEYMMLSLWEFCSQRRPRGSGVPLVEMLTSTHQYFRMELSSSDNIEDVIRSVREFIIDASNIIHCKSSVERPQVMVDSDEDHNDHDDDDVSLNSATMNIGITLLSAEDARARVVDFINDRISRGAKRVTIADTGNVLKELQVKGMMPLKSKATAVIKYLGFQLDSENPLFLDLSPFGVPSIKVPFQNDRLVSDDEARRIIDDLIDQGGGTVLLSMIGLPRNTFRLKGNESLQVKALVTYLGYETATDNGKIWYAYKRSAGAVVDGATRPLTNRVKIDGEGEMLAPIRRPFVQYIYIDFAPLVESITDFPQNNIVMDAISTFLNGSRHFLLTNFNNASKYIWIVNLRQPDLDLFNEITENGSKEASITINDRKLRVWRNDNLCWYYITGTCKWDRLCLKSHDTQSLQSSVRANESQDKAIKEIADFLTSRFGTTMNTLSIAIDMVYQMRYQRVADIQQSYDEGKLKQDLETLRGGNDNYPLGSADIECILGFFSVEIPEQTSMITPDSGIDALQRKDQDEKRLRLQAALARGKTKWGRSKIMIVGEGRAGKTALANSIIGRAFSDTESTIGINQLSCDVKHATTGSQQASALLWKEHAKPPNELLTTEMVDVAQYSLSQTSSYQQSQRDEESDQAQSTLSLQLLAQEGNRIVASDPPASRGLKRSKLNLSSVVVDEETIAKCLSTTTPTNSKLIISIYDFGGQSVFDVIHPFFLTKYGVYVLTFNMKWLTLANEEKKQSCLDYLKFWMNSVVVHTQSDGRTAPIVIVGTKKDSVDDPRQHDEISTLLQATFESNLAWQSILKYNPFDENGRMMKELCFFPVNNKRGHQDPSIKELLSVIEKCLSESDYVNEEKPLSWLQTFDKMTDTKEHYLPYDRAVQLAAECGVLEGEVPVMLQFLFEMGMLMWHNEPGLSDVVIMDPVAFFVTPATVVICKHKSVDGERTRHFTSKHEECRRKHLADFNKMIDSGVVSEVLLKALLSDYTSKFDVIVKLMEKYSLLVHINTAGVYVVPALLPNEPQEVPWIKRGSFFVFAFSVTSSLDYVRLLTSVTFQSEGFLPSGLFERLIGKALLWSQQTGDSTYTLELAQVHKNAAVLHYGGQRFCMRAVPQYNLILVEVEGSNPIPVHNKLNDQINQLISEIMASLEFTTALPLSGVHGSSTDITTALQDFNFLSLARVKRALMENSPLSIGPTMPLIQLADLKAMYGSWMQHNEMSSKYDLFLSHRWHADDFAFTEALVVSFSVYSIGQPSRTIDIFRDRHRLKDDTDFQSKSCHALTNSLVIVPVVTPNALQHMMQHDPAVEDFLLIEWICALMCYRLKNQVLSGTRIQRIAPLVSEELRSEQVLPDTFPTASFEKALLLLRENSVNVGKYEKSDFTVLKIVERIRSFKSTASNSMTATDDRSAVISLLETIKESLDEDKLFQGKSQFLLAALARGKAEWGRSKIMIVGQGRAGKTALANSIIGRTFKVTESTIGINEFTCDVKFAAIRGGNSEWKQIDKSNSHCVAIGGKRSSVEKKQKPAASSLKEDKAFEHIDPKIPSVSVALLERGVEQREKGTLPTTPTVTTGIDVAKITDTPIKASEIARNTDMGSKRLARNISNDCNLVVSLYDFGGQSVFDVIHPFFLTPYGVYVLVFNMEWLVDETEKQSCLNYLKFWLNSIVVHTQNESGDIAHVVLVGTNKDKINDSNDHSRIAKLLKKEFHRNVAWRFILENDSDSISKCPSLCFFPVNNMIGLQDLVMKKLLCKIENCINDSDYIREEKPLSWLQTLDKMTDTEENYLPYDRVVQLAAECGVPADEVPVMLQFLFEMGMLMWHDEDGLRDVVIMDPVAYFVTPATLVICKHRPSDGDATRHFTEMHKYCEKHHAIAYNDMADTGRVSKRLLKALLQDYSSKFDAIVQLMKKYSLLVPVKSLTTTSEKPSETEYIVPALLPPPSKSVDSWSVRTSSFIFAFYVADSLNDSLPPDKLRSEGFLPSGLFERLIGKALLWSQQFGEEFYPLELKQVYKNVAVLYYGNQMFCMTHVPTYNLIHVEADGLDPISVHLQLLDHVRSIISESMKHLKFITALPFPRTDSVDSMDVTQRIENMTFPFVSLEKVTSTIKGKVPLSVGSKTIDPSEVKSLFPQWSHDNSALTHYDLFLSYRWHKDDPPIAGHVFEKLKRYSIPPSARPINTFLDEKRLMMGNNFQDDFVRALTQSQIIVPIVTPNALKRMINHNAGEVDNLLVEWICAILCYRNSPQSSRVQRILPFVFGEVLPDKKTKSLFDADGSRVHLSNVFPTESFKMATSLLSSVGITIESYEEAEFTVAKIVTEILKHKTFKQDIATATADFLDVAPAFVTILHHAVLDCIEMKSSQSAASDVTCEAPIKTSAAAAAVLETTRGAHNFQAAFDILSKPSNAKDPTSSTSLNQLMDDEGVSCASDLELCTKQEVKKFASYLKTIQCRRFIVAMGYEVELIN